VCTKTSYEKLMMQEEIQDKRNVDNVRPGRHHPMRKMIVQDLGGRIHLRQDFHGTQR